MARYPDGIADGDTVELVGEELTLLDPGRPQRTLPAGTQAMVERRSAYLLRLVINDPNPADGLHDAAVVGVSRVRKVTDVA